MSPATAQIHRLRRALLVRVRWVRWTARLRRELRRHGARLILDAPYRAAWDAPPHLRIASRGEGDATFTLRIGQFTHLGRDLTFDIWAGGTNELALGDRFRFDDGVHIQLRSGAIRFAPGCEVRDYTVIKSEGVLTVGEKVPISHGCMIHCKERIELQDLCGLAERVSIIDSEHTPDGTDDHFYQRPLRVDPVVVGRNVFVAAGAVITSGSRIGPNSVVGAGAVLTGGDYPASHIIAGVPARAVRALAGAAGEPSATR